MEQHIYDDVFSELKKKEQHILLNSSTVIEESYNMTIVLKKSLDQLKQLVLLKGFANQQDEINFFKLIKPSILGKLIYYYKLYRLEIACPSTNGKSFTKYFSSELDKLHRIFKDYTTNSEFYRYYKSGRKDRDSYFFLMGNIDFSDGHKSIIFEIDHLFSTYYDYRIARIISDDLLYHYLIKRMQPVQIQEDLFNAELTNVPKDLLWTDSKSALIELVYALHASGAISNGRIGITKIALLFEAMFRIKLGDLHHCFHRMKDRAGDKTAFINQLASNLEKYMNKNLD